MKHSIGLAKVLTMKEVIIDSIDWSSLAKTYNEKHSRDITFEGSSAYLYYITEDSFTLYFSLHVTQASGEKRIVESSSSIYRDKLTGKLSYFHEKSSELPPPNPESVAMGRQYILYNVLPEYVEPFLKTHSVPLLISSSSDSSSAIPLRRITMTSC